MPQPLEETLQHFLVSLQGTPQEKCVYGWHSKSIGQAIRMPDGKIRWVQIAEHKSPEKLALFTQRLLTKDRITGLQAPQVHHLTSQEESLQSFCIMSFIESPVFSSTPELREPIELGGTFFLMLKRQFECLSLVNTPYTSCRKIYIERRIHERYGSHLPTTISNWSTIHGDLHWANLTHDCTLLDWEGWGKGPQYLDIAFLYGYSVAIPEICVRLEKEFPYLFETPDGLICLLFVCSELLRMIELYEDHPQLKPSLETLARRILLDLKNL